MASYSWSRLATLRRRVPLAWRKGYVTKHCIARHSAVETDRFFFSSFEPNRQRQQQLPSTSTSTSISPSFVDIPLLKSLSTHVEEFLSNPTWWIPKKGTGFDNFLPKNKRNENKEEESKGVEEEGNTPDETSSEKSDNQGGEKVEKKKSGDFGSFRSQQNFGGGDSGRGGGGPNYVHSLLTGGVLLLLTYIMMKADSDDGNFPSDFAPREITWSEFCNHLLETGQVSKIVVASNRKLAMVYLKPGAPGLPAQSPRHVSYVERRRRGAQGGPADTEDDSNFDDSSTSLSGHISANPSSLPSSARGGTQHQTVYRFAIGSVEAFEKKLEEAQRAVGIHPSQDIPVQYTSDSTMLTEILSVVPSLVLIGASFYFMRYASGGMGGQGGRGGSGGGMGGIFQFGKSTAKKVSKEDVKINFNDVAGCDEAKKEVMEFVDFLKDPSRFTKLGAKIPKGALLCGPPGTGKTLLAKAVAGEAGVLFYSISGSDFIEMFVGVGPSRVRDLFRDARENAPCIVFIDEIDAVGRQRGRGGVGGNDERENTLNQLLVEMDGFDTSTGVVVLAGTNRVDILDQALTRPGRFDRQITVDKPDLKGRKEIFKVHLKGITLEDSMDDVASRLAGLTPGFAGADIANICNEAAIVAARRKAESVSMDDFEKATDRIIGGLESNKIMSLDDKKIVAHHEAGHAIAGWFLEHADPLLKVTIIPRTSGALGFAQYLPKEVFLRTQEQIMDIVCMALAGRAAEEIFFGRVTTGASDDLRRVTDLVYSTIQVYGMNQRLGQLAFPKDPNAMFDERPYSEKTAKAMDEEAKIIVDAAYQRTLDLLRQHKTDVEKVANLLLEKETITHDDIIESIGPRPFEGDKSYEEFVSKRKKVKQELEGEQRDSKDDEEQKPSSTDGDPLNPSLV